MARKLLLSLLMLLVCVTQGMANDLLDFTEMSAWGQSRAQVLQFGTPGELKENSLAGLQYDLSAVESDIDKVYYYFTDKDELGAVSVYYAAGESEARQLELYNALKDELKARFGAPKYDFGPGEAGKFDPNMAHMTERHAVWDVQKTDIYLEVKLNKPYDGVFLHYTGTEYFEYR